MSALLLIATLCHAGEATVDERRAPSRAIGLEATWEVELDGSLLEVVGYSSRAPVELRIEDATPADGGYRYRLAYTVLEPGRHNLAALLECRDGSPTDDLPALVVEVDSLLPGDGIIGVQSVRIGEEVRIGGYTRMMVLLAIGWLVGLALLILLGRRRVPKPAVVVEASQPTVADLLQPLVLRAAEGSLDRNGQARLERLFIAFWREKLGLGDASMARVMDRLREHEVAGELMKHLTEWFHHPSQSPAIEVPALMEPYREIAALQVEGRATAEAENH
ncbi:hypothetical protein MLD59_07090 [Verrucomicrobiaceae bacterium E54]|nr:hypothetical protein [Verrucomicrobiaceae bacterium E54]